MSRLTKILFVVLALAFGVGGAAAASGAPAMRHEWSALGVSPALGTLIGALEVAAAVALLVGLHHRYRALGAAAATGLTALMLGAIIFHLQANDVPGAMPATVLLVLAGVASAAAYDTLRRAVQVARHVTLPTGARPVPERFAVVAHA